MEKKVFKFKTIHSFPSGKQRTHEDFLNNYEVDVEESKPAIENLIRRCLDSEYDKKKRRLEADKIHREKLKLKLQNDAKAEGLI